MSKRETKSSILIACAASLLGTVVVACGLFLAVSIRNGATNVPGLLVMAIFIRIAPLAFSIGSVGGFILARAVWRWAKTNVPQRVMLVRSCVFASLSGCLVAVSAWLLRSLTEFFMNRVTEFFALAALGLFAGAAVAIVITNWIVSEITYEKRLSFLRSGDPTVPQ